MIIANRRLPDIINDSDTYPIAYVKASIIAIPKEASQING